MVLKGPFYTVPAVCMPLWAAKRVPCPYIEHPGPGSLSYQVFCLLCDFDMDSRTSSSITVSGISGALTLTVSGISGTLTLTVSGISGAGTLVLFSAPFC